MILQSGVLRTDGFSYGEPSLYHIQNPGPTSCGWPPPIMPSSLSSLTEGSKFMSKTDKAAGFMPPQILLEMKYIMKNIYQ